MLFIGLVVLIGGGGIVVAQTEGTPEYHSWSVTNRDIANRYESQYGEPEFWTLTLLVGPDARRDVPAQRSIRTVGRLRVMERPRSVPQVWLCTEDNRGCLDLDTPVREIGDAFFAEASFRRDNVAEVVGAFGVDGARFLFWSFASAPPGPERNRTRAVTLEDLVISPAEYVGRRIAVRGRFQGRNLFEDMPEKSALGRDDWVLKDAGCFIWVTGHAAQGDGFSLDLDDRAAASYRLEVEGEPEVHDGLIYLKASTVRLLGRAIDDPES